MMLGRGTRWGQGHISCSRVANIHLSPPTPEASHLRSFLPCLCGFALLWVRSICYASLLCFHSVTQFSKLTQRYFA